MIKVHESLIKWLTASGIQPKHQVLGNEASKAHKLPIKESGMMYDIVSFDMHRWNNAEKVMHTYKDHFVAILHGVDELFPIYCGVDFSHRQNQHKIC